MVWRPNKALGLVIGLVILLTIIGVDILLLRSILGHELDLNLFLTALLLVLSLPLAGLWGFWYLGLVTLHYYLDRNVLIIIGGMSRHVIPIAAIRGILSGSEVHGAGSFRGVGWPGYLSGSQLLDKLGLVYICSTEPLDRQLIIVTDTACYGISPRAAQRFLADFAARRALGPMHDIAQITERSTFSALPVWHDGWFWILCAWAFIANAVLFGFIAAQYGRLFERIPLHFDALGQVDRIAHKSGLLIIPGIGAFTFGVNSLLGLLVHRRERLAAYLLLVSSLVVQAVTWLAVQSVLGRG